MTPRIFSQITVNPDELDIPKATASQSTVSTALELVFMIIGGLALIIIVYAGLKFVLSRGNAESSAKARNTIIYAAVGLAVSMLAFAIVRFVVRQVVG